MVRGFRKLTAIAAQKIRRRVLCHPEEQQLTRFASREFLMSAQVEDPTDETPQCTNVAPLVGFWGCEVEADEIPVGFGVALVRGARVEVDEEWARKLGTEAIDELRRARWALVHSCPGQPGVHLGSEEKLSDQLLQTALLALWITKPTGARITHLLRYRTQWYSSNAASVSFYRGDTFRPNLRYERATLVSGDLDALNVVFKGVKSVFDKKKGLRRALYHLSGALYLWFWDARFTMFTAVLESLFSTDAQEITHKISERIAFFLGDTPAERRSLFENVKGIYRTRSRIVHGLDLKATEEETISALAELEELVHQILSRILRDSDLIDQFSGNAKRRERFLTDLVFC